MTSSRQLERAARAREPPARWPRAPRGRPPACRSTRPLSPCPLGRTGAPSCACLLVGGDLDAALVEVVALVDDPLEAHFVRPIRERAQLEGLIGMAGTLLARRFAPRMARCWRRRAAPVAACPAAELGGTGRPGKPRRGVTAQAKRAADLRKTSLMCERSGVRGLEHTGRLQQASRQETGNHKKYRASLEFGRVSPYH